MKKTPVGLVGVTGYAGMELLRLLAAHPSFELVRGASRSEAGRRLDDLYPFLAGFDLGALTVVAPEAGDLASACELVFLAVPHGAAMDYAAELLAAGVRVVDFSADFRLLDQKVYAAWYGLDHRHPGLLPEAVYGLPELYADRIAGARLVANPGCYPTSVILGLAPALAHGLVETDGLVADSKSGTSGAGRKALVATLFCEVHDTFRAYNLGKHRHTPEIEQELSKLAGADLILSFNPHLLPIDRGILSTLYGRLRKDVSLDEVHALYEAYYRDHPWVRVLPKGKLSETRFVRGTMFCDVSLTVDARARRLVVCSAIDNLCRGAAGQALCCANLMLGQDPAAGLNLPPLMP